MRETHHHRRLGACPRNGLHFAQSKFGSGFSSHSCRLAYYYLFDRHLFAGHTLCTKREKKIIRRSPVPALQGERDSLFIWKLYQFVPSSTLTTTSRLNMYVGDDSQMCSVSKKKKKIQLSVDLKRRHKLSSHPG